MLWGCWQCWGPQLQFWFHVQAAQSCSTWRQVKCWGKDSASVFKCCRYWQSCLLCSLGQQGGGLLFSIICLISLFSMWCSSKWTNYRRGIVYMEVGQRWYRYLCFLGRGVTEVLKKPTARSGSLVVGAMGHLRSFQLKWRKDSKKKDFPYPFQNGEDLRPRRMRWVPRGGGHINPRASVDGRETPFPLLPNSCSGIYSRCSGTSPDPGFTFCLLTNPKCGWTGDLKVKGSASY